MDLYRSIFPPLITCYVTSCGNICVIYYCPSIFCWRNPASCPLFFLGPFRLGVAKSDTTHEPDTTNLFINRLWVEAKQVQVISRLAWPTRLINGLCSCLTCEPV